MNPEIKTEWLAALRSGEYKQETGILRARGGFCCLGVLCDLYVKKGIGEWISISPDPQTPNNSYTLHVEGQIVTWGLPGVIQDKADLVQGGATIPVNSRGRVMQLLPSHIAANAEDEGGFKTLADINDSGGSFADIANIIEEIY